MVTSGKPGFRVPETVSGTFSPIKLTRRLLRRIRPARVEAKVRWFGADSIREAASGLSARAQAVQGREVLVIGDGGKLERELSARLRKSKVVFQVVDLDTACSLGESESECFALILCALSSARGQSRAAALLAAHPVLGQKSFEHAAGLDGSRRIFHALDEYAETDFVSPVLLDDPTPYAIYQESLKYFQQKCGLRDYLDLYQLLKAATDNDVEGDIAEFGSFRGHSGWLISRTLEALGSDKHLFMFDTFESFPSESYGVDHFWSDTHRVDFDEVRAKFEGRTNVTLVKGDFTQTLAQSRVGKLALAYIDCDSYRATRYLLQVLPDTYIAAHGAMVCEDYGHPALLGNRVAVHEVCDSLRGWFRFFSQFSGLYVMVKLGNK